METSILLCIILCLLLFIYFTKKKESNLDNKKKLEEALLPYRLRPSVMNHSESAFFYELQKQMPSGYYIFPKMRIIDFIAPTNQDYGWRSKIWAKHVDFLICNKYLKPVLAIEVNGKSHQRWDRIGRDEFITKVFSKSDLRIEFIKVGTDFKRTIDSVLKNHGIKN